MEYRLHQIADGSVTVTCGAWILYRLYPDGRVKTIGYDAPLRMCQDALEALRDYAERHDKPFKW